jgi:hypothetical protein
VVALRFRAEDSAERLDQDLTSQKLDLGNDTIQWSTAHAAFPRLSAP